MNRPGPEPSPEDDLDAMPISGMERTTPERALAAERAAVARSAESADGPAVTEDKLKLLKAKARAEIDARLTDRRKKRRLLRGNQSDAHPTL